MAAVRSRDGEPMSTSVVQHEIITERRQRVETLTNKGHSIRDIAAWLNISTRTVERDRSVLGIAQPANKPLSKTEYERAEAMIEDGYSQAEIARTLGRSADTICHHFKGRSKSDNLRDSIQLRKQLGLLLT